MVDVSQQPQMLSDVISVVVFDAKNKSVNRSNLDDPLVLLFRLEAVDQQCGLLSCQFFDKKLNAWNSKGCVTKHVEHFGQGAASLTCECDHLTDFAVLQYVRARVACVKSNMLGTALHVYMGVYGCLAVVCLIQMFRAGTCAVNVTKNWNIIVPHALICVLCAARIVELVHFTNIMFDTGMGEGLVIALPDVLHIWVFAAMVKGWAEIVHRKSLCLSSKEKRMQTRVFYVVTIALSVISCTLFVLTDQSGNYVVPAAVMAGLWVVMGTVFAVYANLIAQKAKAGTRANRNISKSREGSVSEVSVEMKLMLIGDCVALCFVIEAGVSIFAVAIGDIDVVKIAVATVVYLLVDIITLVAIVLLYRQTIAVARDQNPASSRQSHSHSRSASKGHSKRGQSSVVSLSCTTLALNTHDRNPSTPLTAGQSLSSLAIRPVE